MRRDDDGRPPRRREPREERDDVRARGAVEVPRRLVGEDDARLLDERPGDRDALLLAAGEMRRQVGRAIGEADLLEQGERAGTRLVVRDAGRSDRRLHVVDCGERRDQVELLEHEPERPQPEIGEGGVAERAEVLAFEAHGPLARAVERAEQLEQRRLARAARADERDELARADVEVDPVERASRWRDRAGRTAPRHAPRRALCGHHSTCLSASAGRMRAARQPPAAPATRPPRIATRRPSRRTSSATGAVSATWSVTVRAVDLAEPEEVRRRVPPPVDEDAVSVGPTAPMTAASATPRTTPISPPATTLGERLPDDLADDDALLPAERLQRADLADALADRGEREQQRDQEGGQRREDRRARRRGDARGWTRRRASRRCGRRRRGRSRPGRSGTPSRCSAARSATSSPLSARTSTTLTCPFWEESFCSCASGT